MRRDEKKPRRPSRHDAPAPVPRLRVESLAWGGRGVGRHEGKVVFVSKAVPGDEVAVALDCVKSSYSEGHIVSLLSPGEDRVDPGCPHFSRCGGCQWLAVSYRRQLREKEALLKSILRHHLAGLRVDPIVPSEPPAGYRHRGDFHVKASGRDLLIGFFEEGSHRVADLDSCLLFGPAFNSFLGDLRTAFRDEPAALSLAGFTLAADEEGRSFSLHLRVSGDRVTEAEALAEIVSRLGARGVLCTPVAEPGRVLAGRGKARVTFGLPSAGESRGDLVVQADVRSFTQGHYAMNRRLVAGAAEWIGLSRNDRLLDLFSGVGNFSLPLATACREVVAVESNPFACEDAKANAQANGLTNLRHLAGDAGEWVGRLAAASERFDAVVLDPPRAGARGVIEPLPLLGAKRILYVSCSSPSLERDLEEFGKRGYVPVRVQPWDMFPHSYGVETLCLLVRRTATLLPHVRICPK